MLHGLRLAQQGFQLGWTEFSIAWSVQSWLLMWLIRMASQAAFIAMLGQLVGSSETVRYLVIGNVVMIGALATQLGAGALAGDRWRGTYPLLVIAPASLVPVTLGRNCVPLLNGLATSLVSFVVVGPLFGISVPWPETLLALPLVVLTLASVFCQTLFLAGVAARVPKYSGLTHTTMIAVMQAVCGVNMPVSFWPTPIQALANSLPLTHGLQSVRLVLDCGSAPAALQEGALEAAVGLVWLVAGILLLDWLTNSGRADGSIELTLA
jgi:ABC-2 type transport system permease protein